MRAFDEICVQPSFNTEERLTPVEAGLLCAVIGTAVAVASTVATGHLPEVLKTYVFSHIFSHSSLGANC